MIAGWILVASVAQAETSISVDAISVDGLSVRALSCSLEKGGLLASAMVVGALSSKKAALDACAPGGAAFSATWTWGAETVVASVSGSKPDATDCVTAALKDIPSPVVGTCSALVLTGEPAAAAAAADAIQAAPSTP